MLYSENNWSMFIKYLIWTGMISLLLTLSSCLNGHELVDNTKSPDDWKKISEQNFTLSIPKDLMDENKSMMDSFAVRYSDKNLTVSIESAAGTETQDYLRSQDRVLNFQQIPLNRPGLTGSQATFEFKKESANFEDPGKRLVKILSVDCKNVEKSVTFMILYSDIKYENTASQILNSVNVNCSN